MCQFGTTTPTDSREGDVGRVKKPTGFMTSSHHIAGELNRLCDASRDHVHLDVHAGVSLALHLSAQIQCTNHISNGRPKQLLYFMFCCCVACNGYPWYAGFYRQLHAAPWVRLTVTWLAPATHTLPRVGACVTRSQDMLKRRRFYINEMFLYKLGRFLL